MNFIRHRNNRFYYFINFIDDKIQKDILKYKNISLIIEKKIFCLNNSILKNIIKFCKKNNINFYIQDNYKVALRLKANGVYLSSDNRKIPIISLKKLYIIGHVHSQKDYYFKRKQNCNLIILSSLFYNVKYSKYKILGITRFNLITLYWKENICCLGGVNSNNLNQTRMLKATSIGFKSSINEQKKKPVYFRSRRVNFELNYN